MPNGRAVSVSLSALLVASVALSACSGGAEKPTAPAPAAATSAPSTPSVPSPAQPRVSPAATASGAHASYAASGFTCVTCHPCGVKDPNGHGLTWMDTTSTAFHAYSANQNLAGCQACHGPALDGVGGSTAVSCASCHGATWKTGCTTCHGGTDNSTGAPPRTTWGHSTETVRVGTHTAHLAATHALSRPVACSACHVVPADALSPGHANGATADVAFSGLAVQGAAPAWNRTSATCSNTYCHGSTLAAGGSVTAPTWTTTDGSARACTACHGAPPPSPHPANADCGACHPGYTATTVAAATHIDGKLDVTGMTCTSCHGDATRAATTLNPQLAAAPPAGTKGETATTTRAVGAHQRHLVAGALSNGVACSECHVPPTSTSHSNGVVDLAWGTLARTGNVSVTWNGSTCSGTYCHGNFRNGNLTYAPSWTLPATTACGTCHGLPPGGTHPTNASSCGSCHNGYTATTVNLATHMNGTVDVVAMTCTSCHGDATRAATALNPQLAAAPPAGTKGETATTTRAVGAHQAHLVNTTLRSAALACTECHAVPTSTSHASGTVEMTWGALARTGNFTPTWTGTTCTNYCHGSSLGAGGSITAPSWTSGSTQDACGTCHGVPPPAPHSTSTACGTCHAGYTATSVNLATHINGVVDVTSNHPAGWATKAQHGYQVNLTGLAGCKSCHGTDLAGGTSGVSCATCHATNGFAAWDTNCTFCHGNRTTGRQSPPVDIQGRTVTTNTSVGRHDSHVGSTMMAAITCAACHPARSTSVITDTAHVDGNGVAEVALQSYAYTSGASTTTINGTYTRTSATAATCTVYCHSNFSTTSGGARTSLSKSWVATTATSCTTCHSTKSSRHTSGKHGSQACSVCHGAGYTSTAVTGTAVATHVDGRKTVFTTATGTGIRTWNAATRSCTSSCHGTETW